MKTLIAFAAVFLSTGDIFASPPLKSIDTGKYTILKVRTAREQDSSYIVASSYEGTVLAVGYDGKVRWRNRLSGFMNHDVWCEDIDGDERDEILTANADGSIYCINHRGEARWKFSANDAPLSSVCVVRKDGESYVVCGGYDRVLYYLTSSGRLVKSIDSASYSQDKTWGKGPKRIPAKGIHSINFLRRVRAAGGKELLVVNGVVNSHSSPGTLYFFPPLGDVPESAIRLTGFAPLGELRVSDIDDDGVDEILLGTSSMIQDAAYCVVRPEAGEYRATLIEKQRSLRKEMDRFGYRVLQPEVVTIAGKRKAMLLLGSRMLFCDSEIPVPMPVSEEPDGSKEQKGPEEPQLEFETLACRYAFNDMWRDPETGRVILASSQSGGSCIHIIDVENPGWKEAYETLSPPGKISKILKNTSALRQQLADFKKPAGERDPIPVFFMTESIPDSLAEQVESYNENVPGLVFLKGQNMPRAEDWDRSGMTNEKYRERRDGRKQYTATRQEILDQLIPHFEDHPGIAYWGGHGNDPYMISLETQKKIVDEAAKKGKKIVMIYPELEDPSEDFRYVMDNLVYPLAEYCQGKNVQLYIRTKHVFWQTAIYEPMWSRLLSGEFSDVFVPSMEETGDKSMELSLASRMGLWASGIVDDWGARCARDNASYNRLRQHAHQMLPNHFLRNQVYTISSGARYLNNFPVDQEYMSVLWDLIARGVLHVPKPDEIVSFSPVHLSMVHPDEHFADDGNNVKWTLFYDREFEERNPFVFSRLNGSWPGAPVMEWDFSRYAAGVHERRLSFLPPYNNGLVLITPEQKDRPPETSLRNRLHPLYKNILKEFLTDGRYYYAQDKSEKYGADVGHIKIRREIRNSAKEIPITVTGNVAWVAAVSSPRNIRLTLVDSGYVNPGEKQANITFNTVTPVAVTDVLSKEKIAVENGKTAQIKVPCGLFRFFDIEIEKEL